MIRAAALCLALAGCATTNATTATAPAAATTPALPAVVQKVVVALCSGDQIIQPAAVAIADAVATPVGGAVEAAITSGVTTDTLLVHPAVLAACTALNAKPMAVLSVQPVAPAAAANNQ